MSTANLKKLYDFEAAVEAAIKALLETYELTVFTSGDEWDFENDRPRVVVYFTRGEGQQRYAPRESLPVGLQNQKIESAWKSQVEFVITCNADADGKKTLAEYRSIIRSLVPQMPRLINGVYLQNHALQFPQDGGDTRETASEKGVERLTINAQFALSVQASAWALLA